MSASAVYPASYCAVWVHAVCFSPLSLGEERVQRWLTVLPILCGRGNGRNQQQEQATPAQWLQTYREHPGQVLSGELTRRRDTVAAVAEAGLVLRNTVCGDGICHLCFGSSVHFKFLFPLSAVTFTLNSNLLTSENRWRGPPPPRGTLSPLFIGSWSQQLL